MMLLQKLKYFCLLCESLQLSFWRTHFQKELTLRLTCFQIDIEISPHTCQSLPFLYFNTINILSSLNHQLDKLKCFFRYFSLSIHLFLHFFIFDICVVLFFYILLHKIIFICIWIFNWLLLNDCSFHLSKYKYFYQSILLEEPTY